MSLSPFDSFQSRFVTYLLNFSRMTISSLHSDTRNNTYPLQNHLNFCVCAVRHPQHSEP